MRRAPLVTYVVVNWRAEDATARCVASIRAQEGVAPHDREIRVVDNASTPASAAALEALGVVVVASPRNTGFAGGANLGIAGSRGRFVAIVNNDAVLEPGWTAHGVALMEADPRVALVGGADLAWDDGGSVGAPRIDPDGGFATASPADRPQGEVLALNGSNLLARGDVLRSLGGFDTAFFAYYEDTDLSARVWARGHRVVFAPAMRARHRRNLSSDRMPFRKLYLAQRNHMRLVAKHFPDGAWGAAVRRAAVHHLVSGITGRVAGTRERAAGAPRRAHLASGAWGLLRRGRLARERRAALARGEHYAGFRAHARRQAEEAP